MISINSTGRALLGVAFLAVAVAFAKDSRDANVSPHSPVNASYKSQATRDAVAKQTPDAGRTTHETNAPEQAVAAAPAQAYPCQTSPTIPTSTAGATGPEQLGTLTATVQDATTGRPVVGALFHWSFNGHHTMTGSTDKQGRFAIQAPVAERTQGQMVQLSIEGNGYRALLTNARACAGTKRQIALKLEPAGRFGTVEGQITDSATRRGIPNANIAVLIGRFPQVGLSATSGFDGRYTIRNVGFSHSLNLQVNLPSQRCVPATTRKLDVQGLIVTENFSLPLSRAPWRCPPSESGDLSSGMSDSKTALPISPSLSRVESAFDITPAPTITDHLARANPAHDPLLPDEPNIQWQPATTEAIQASDSLNAWNSGHVNDILKIGPFTALIASETGGVWLLEWNSATSAARSLSIGWGANAMTSLAQGPDGVNHVYAGTFNFGTGNSGGVLWETDTSAAEPLMNWVAHAAPTGCMNINHILVIPELRRIVLACNDGVWWSTIPAPPAARTAYNWLAAQPGSGVIPELLQGGIARLAKGPGWGAPGDPPTEGTIAVSAWGGTVPGQLMYWGGWSNGQLVLNNASIPPPLMGFPPVPQFDFGRSALAACPLDAHRMYAVAADGNNVGLAALWQSSDGGQSWALVNSPPNGTGGQGWYNQALAVSAADCNTFAIGWEYRTFVSFDGGNTYPVALDGAASGCNANVCQLHDDYHALLFDPDDPATLWIGSDGGLSSASGVLNNHTPTFASYYNQHLMDLQFYHTAPSFHSSNLAAGALQDNAVVWSVLPNWWTRVPGANGDGAYTEFAGVGPASTSGGSPGSTDILAWNSHTVASQESIWTGSGFSSNSPTIPVSDSQSARDPNGIVGSPNWNVRTPTFSNAAGQLMYLVKGVNSDVYGLFAESDGSDMHWESLGSIGSAENVTAISSFNGNVVFVGSDQGNICQLTQPYTGPCVDFAISPPPAGTTAPIRGLFELSSTLGFATTGSVPGYVLTLTGPTWQVADGGLPSSLPFVSIDGPDQSAVFAANANQVFVTFDLGSNWLSASDGLPSVANANELHYVLQPDGQAYMYLSTYGWSMFRAPWRSSFIYYPPVCTAILSCSHITWGFPNLLLQCPSPANFYEGYEGTTSQPPVSTHATSFSVQTNNIFGAGIVACAGQQPAPQGGFTGGECSSYSTYASPTYCGAEPPQPPDFCKDCQKTGGRCTTLPDGRKVCVHE